MEAKLLVIDLASYPTPRAALDAAFAGNRARERNRALPMCVFMPEAMETVQKTCAAFGARKLTASDGSVYWCPEQDFGESSR